MFLIPHGGPVSGETGLLGNSSLARFRDGERSFPHRGFILGNGEAAVPLAG